jgi:ferredoxin
LRWRSFAVTTKAERKRRFAGVQMFIDPDDCIDCGACVPECPEDAIEHDIVAAPDDTERNRRFFSGGRTPTSG